MSNRNFSAVRFFSDWPPKFFVFGLVIVKGGEQTRFLIVHLPVFPITIWKKKEKKKEDANSTLFRFSFENPPLTFCPFMTRK